jgi:hypothetical protein
MVFGLQLLRKTELYWKEVVMKVVSNWKELRKEKNIFTRKGDKFMRKKDIYE